mgnify:CR=1 FL=1
MRIVIASATLHSARPNHLSCHRPNNNSALSTDSLTHSITRPLTHPLTHSLTHPLRFVRRSVRCTVRWFIRSVVRSLCRWFVGSLVRWFVRLFVGLFVCSFVRLFVCSFVRLFVCLFVGSLFVGSFVRSSLFFSHSQSLIFVGILHSAHCRSQLTFVRCSVATPRRCVEVGCCSPTLTTF